MKANANLSVLVMIAFALMHCSAADASDSEWAHPVLRWAPPVRKFNQDVAGSALHQKMDQFVIPKLDLHEATLPESVAILHQLSVAADSGSHKGVIFRLQGGAAEPALQPTLTLSLRKVSLGEATQYVATLANCKIVELDNEVVLVSH
jgi:hypothetical protein